MRLNLAVHTYQSWVEAHFKSSVWRYIHISRGLRLTLSRPFDFLLRLLYRCVHALYNVVVSIYLYFSSSVV